MDPTEQTAPEVPLHEQPEVHARRWLILSVMCLSLVLVVMAVSGLNVALPTLQQDLGASGTQLLWIVAAYAIVFAGLLLTAGAIGDKYGRKGAFALSVVIVVVTGVVFYRLTEDWSVADSLYFTVIALTTIGFGDFAPTTTLSRLFTTVYAIIGVGLIGILVHLIVSNAQQAMKH